MKGDSVSRLLSTRRNLDFRAVTKRGRFRARKLFHENAAFGSRAVDARETRYSVVIVGSVGLAFTDRVRKSNSHNSRVNNGFKLDSLVYRRKF